MEWEGRSNDSEVCSFISLFLSVFFLGAHNSTDTFPENDGLPKFPATILFAANILIKKKSPLNCHPKRKRKTQATP